MSRAVVLSAPTSSVGPANDKVGGEIGRANIGEAVVIRILRTGGKVCVLAKMERQFVQRGSGKNVRFAHGRIVAGCPVGPKKIRRIKRPGPSRWIIDVPPVGCRRLEVGIDLLLTGACRQSKRIIRRVRGQRNGRAQPRAGLLARRDRPAVWLTPAVRAPASSSAGWARSRRDPAPPRHHGRSE